MVQRQGIRILIIDDERTIRRFLTAALVAQGYTVSEAVDGKEGLESAVSAHPDVIVLDLGLPDMDGRDVIRRIRERSRIPIIILSVREEEADKIAALDAGADDYLTKPFNAGEMLARIRAVMRRLLPQNERSRLAVQGLAIDLSARMVEVCGKQVHLTPTEYDVLKTLALNAGSVMTHGQILKEIWNKNEDYEEALHLLRVTISNLRNKIEPDPNQPAYILTEPAIGYRLSVEN